MLYFCVWCVYLMRLQIYLWSWRMGQRMNEYEAQVQVGYLPFVFHLYLFETGSLSETWNSVIYLNWLASEFQSSTFMYFPSFRATGICAILCILFLDCWASKLSSCVHGRCLTNKAIFAAPIFMFWDSLMKPRQVWSSWLFLPLPPKCWNNKHITTIYGCLIPPTPRT